MSTKVLVIDDDTIVRRLVCSALKKMEYTAFEACTGQTGIMEFDKVKPDLVITDVMMPDKNGLETIAALRAKRPDLKIIAMSGGGSVGGQDFLTVAKDLGAAATLKKPFEVEDLKAALDKAGV
jgi:DNA-binding response OmpR family regulator